MEWRIENKTKLAQVGYKFPSDTSTCEVSVNASLAGHKNYMYPLDKIKGNTGEIGIWLFEITKNRGLVKNLKGGFLLEISALILLETPNRNFLEVIRSYLCLV